MLQRIEVGYRHLEDDVAGQGVRASLQEDLGVRVNSVEFVDVFESEPGFSSKDLFFLAENLFSDPITQTVSIGRPLRSRFDFKIEVRFHGGVLDNVGEMAAYAVRQMIPSAPADLRIHNIRQYVLHGRLTLVQAEKICTKLLANPLIEHYTIMQRKANER
ncbi:MAG: phosphoribosylformylglycinamidine synthase subunit PurS [Candidatus Diapherotrites archaeon]|nr:phosphoribosylformylglycinamidine synthase subunit PurS [Candidatus Diapherotrites archaeon]